MTSASIGIIPRLPVGAMSYTAALTTASTSVAAADGGRRAGVWLRGGTVDTVYIYAATSADCTAGTETSTGNHIVQRVPSTGSGVAPLLPYVFVPTTGPVFARVISATGTLQVITA